MFNHLWQGLFMRSIIKTALLFFLFSSVAANVQAAESYELPDGTILEGVERFDGTLPKAAYTILGVTLDEHKLTDVFKSFGTSAKILKASDADDTDSVCYFSSVDHKVRLTFSSGGSENATDKLSSFTLSSNGSPNINGRCAKSSKLTKKVMTSNALSLGLSQAEVTAILGTPSKMTSDWIIFAYENYHAYSRDERANMPRAPDNSEYKGRYDYHDLRVHFVNGKSDELSVAVTGELDW